jgi:hypothetical protein
MRCLTLAEIEELRRTPGASLVLFLTDRCPVGCGHCSVASTVDSPTITDWRLFHEIVAGIAALPDLRAVAVTGGEPFTQRRGLEYAVSRIADADKAIVLFTSGYWARSTTPAWIRSVLGRVSTVYLSTDSHHAPRVGDRLPAAAAAVTEAGCQLVLQVIDEPGAIESARNLSPTAEISLIPPLGVGRGATLFARPPRRPVTAFGRCSLLNSPTVRYDGRITACCNEAVIMGAGPTGLHRRVTGAHEVAAALSSLRREPVLRLIHRFGPTALTSIVDGQFDSPCGPCWAAIERAQNNRVEHAIASVLAAANLGGTR